MKLLSREDRFRRLRRTGLEERTAVNNLRNLALWIIIALLLVACSTCSRARRARPASTTTNYTEFNQEVVQGQVKKVTFQGDQIKGELTNGQPFTTVRTQRPGLRPAHARAQCRHHRAAGR